MKILNKLLLVLTVFGLLSCDDKLTELNVNPLGVDPATVNPNLVLTTVITNTAKPYLAMSYNGDVAGVMQYVQKSGWSSGLNKFDWVGERGWGGSFANLRNAKHLYERSEEEGMEFQMGAAVVLRAYNYGYIADSWGDAPYTLALNGADGEQEHLFPVFDTQETIYKGIIGELKSANELLSKSVGDYKSISPSADVIYGGNPEKWRKFANSLMLRYYMRVSEKLPQYAKEGIQEIISNPSTYPIFTSNDDDATMAYIGSSDADAWPANTDFDASESNFNRLQLCNGFRDVLVGLNDHRLGVWFNKVRTQIKVSEEHPEDDIVVDNIRYIRPDYMAAQGWVVYNKDTWIDDLNADKLLVDTMEYVGIPLGSSTGDGSGWNLNPNPTQGGFNVHNSALTDMYKSGSGDFLKARMISYAEICFILSEAAQKTWSVGGSQQEWYEKGVKASFDTWGVSENYDDYIAGAGVVYDGSLEQLMVQKWIANWTVAHEAWCDWRRTGLPQLKFGPTVTRDAMPLRYMYGGDEKNRNNTNYLDAIDNLQQTDFTATDGNDSSWSKFWLIQGTPSPY